MNFSKPSILLPGAFFDRFGRCGLAAAALLFAFRAGAGTNTLDYTQPGTLAYHLATNAVGHAAGRTGADGDMVEIHALLSIEVNRFLLPSWSQNFWLKEVQGLSATPIGFNNMPSGQGLLTMVSPRHYLCATHMHPEGLLAGFLDNNNRLLWRKTLQRVDVGNDTSVGLLDADLPPSVGFLPVLPDNYTNYLPVTGARLVQGIGMNQNMLLFGQPMNFAGGPIITWNSHDTVPFGLDTNWNVTIRAGDSSNPGLLLIGNQLVLVSHNYFVGGGPNYASQIPAINRAMHQLSTNNQVGTDYQLTQFPLTNWPVIH
jgi:hypothetical protein